MFAHYVILYRAFLAELAGLNTSGTSIGLSPSGLAHLSSHLNRLLVCIQSMVSRVDASCRISLTMGLFVRPVLVLILEAGTRPSPP